MLLLDFKEREVYLKKLKGLIIGNIFLHIKLRVCKTTC
jgi:hypothetical protein